VAMPSANRRHTRSGIGAHPRSAYVRPGGRRAATLRVRTDLNGRRRPYDPGMRRLPLLATVLAGLAFAGAAVTAALLVAYGWKSSVVLPFAGLSAVGMAIAITGVVVARRVPDNPVGVLLTAIGTMATLLHCRSAYEAVALAHGLPLEPRVIAWFEESGWWIFAMAGLLLLLFPTGRLPGRRWRWVAWSLVVATAANQVYGAFETDDFLGPMKGQPRPYPPPPLLLDVAGFVAFVAVLGLSVSAVASVIVRFRRADGLERAQLKWLAFAGLAVVAYPFVCGAELLLTGTTGWSAAVIGLLAAAALPVSVAVAMLRQDLYDVDRALSAAVAYGIATAVLLGLFVAVTVTAGLVLGRGAVTAAVATAVCALALSPLRRRVQRGVDRGLNPPRRAARSAIESLQRGINLGEAQPEDLQAALRTALRNDSIRVGLRRPGTGQLVDVGGAAVAGRDAVPVRLGDDQVGVLAADDEPGRAVLRAIAPDTAILVHAMRLRAELADALREVNDSRTRLIHAGIAERFRLERDLHDGAQQRLVALGMVMRTAQLQMGTGVVDIDALIDRAVAELAAAVAELRQIAHGLRPSSLDDGLSAALTGMTRSLPVPVHIAVDADRLSDDVATTAYYVACEAVTNAAKHAGAGQVTVKVSRAGNRVMVRVADDGHGGAHARPGSGLAGLMDRVAALGGSLSMHSPIGRGTVIEAELPCGS
jgi:signal transduction histidine kinase